MRGYASLLFAAMLLGAPQALAQEAVTSRPDARFNAFACETLPNPLRLSVEAMDDDEEHLRLRDLLIDSLRRAGIEVADGAPAILLLEARKVVEFEQRRGGELFELRAGQENVDIGREGDLFVRGHVWSNRSDSVLGGRKRDPGQLSLDRLEVSVTVNRRSDGRCLWRGEVRHSLGGDDPKVAGERIMQAIVGSMGQTVRNRALEITP